MLFFNIFIDNFFLFPFRTCIKFIQKDLIIYCLKQGTIMKKMCKFFFGGLFFWALIMSLHGMEEQKNDVRLMLLNGASCAGKTSLAVALVKELKSKGMTNVEHVSFDELFVNIVKDGRYMDQQLQYYQELGHPVFSDSREKKSKREDQYFGLFYQQLLERMRRGKIIVADHCFSTKESFLDFLEAFYAFHKNIVLIKVFCDYKVAQQRLEKRNGGYDQTQHRQDWCFEQHYKEPKKSIIYENKRYHAELDTSAITPEEGAEQLTHFFDEPLHQDSTDIVRKNYINHDQAIRMRYQHNECVIS